MQLLSEEIRQQLPPLCATEGQRDPMVICKFFTPWAHWAWYVVEGEASEYEDGEDSHWYSDYLFFGWVCTHVNELGCFRLSELESLRGPFELTVERDLYFKPERLSVIRELCGKEVINNVDTTNCA